MNWTAGYASDVEYTSNFYREQAPAFLNFICVLNNFEPVDTNRHFTYCELGFGRGLTANILAATHPQGQFYATDFNPAHVVSARKMAESAGLDNLKLFEHSFEEMADGACADLPQFDFISLHGIYTWVTKENQAHIQRFISRYLKPGGIVYVSYNAMPGWGASTPVQRLLVEHAACNPKRSDLQVKEAAAFVSMLAKADRGYFKVNDAAMSRAESIPTLNPQYLVHEYMHRHWQPLYHADVARDMAESKLDYVGSCDTSMAYPGMLLPADVLAQIEAITDSAFRETAKDYVLNTAFRRDVYVRGARKLSPRRQFALLAQFGLSPTLNRARASSTIKLPLVTIEGKPDYYNPVLDALTSGPKTLAELAALPAFGGNDMASVTQIAALLTATLQTTIYFKSAVPVSKDAAKRLNAIICEASLDGEDYPALASAVWASGVPADLFERSIYLALHNGVGIDDIAGQTKFVWQVMKALGRAMTRDGKPLEGDAENLEVVESGVRRIHAEMMPIWRGAGLI